MNLSREYLRKKFTDPLVARFSPDLSYKDVLIQQRESNIKSRKQISTRSTLVPGLSIEVPVVTANMDTVTEHRMAEAAAFAGGGGVIHRFMSVESQVDEVKKVKSRTRVIEDNPPHLPRSATVADAEALLQEWKRGYVVVTPSTEYSRQYSGIATPKDFYRQPKDMPLGQVMTPREMVKTVKEGTSLEDAVLFMRDNRLEKVFVTDTDGLLVGVYTVKDFELQESNPLASKDSKGRLIVGAAVGVSESDRERARALVEEGEVDFLVVDIAHGQLASMKGMLYDLKHVLKIKKPIIAGNISDGKGARDLRQWGADAVKVGVGAGIVCLTRVVAAAGKPMIASIASVKDAFMQDGDEQTGIIGDGGVRVIADVGKAKAAGAKWVMVGSGFSGTPESPGEVIYQDGRPMKLVRGMASLEANQDRVREEGGETNDDEYIPEGRTILVPVKPKGAKVIMHRFHGGLQSAYSYAGTTDSDQFFDRSQFNILTSEGSREQSSPLEI